VVDHSVDTIVAESPVTTAPSRAYTSPIENPDEKPDLLQAATGSDNVEKIQTTNRIDIHLVDIGEPDDVADSTEYENVAAAESEQDDVKSNKENAKDKNSGSTTDPNNAIATGILSSPLSDSNKGAVNKGSVIDKGGAANDHAFDDSEAELAFETLSESAIIEAELIEEFAHMDPALNDTGALDVIVQETDLAQDLANHFEDQLVTKVSDDEDNESAFISDSAADESSELVVQPPSDQLPATAEALADCQHPL